MPAPTTAPSNASSLAYACVESAVTPTVAAVTVAMISDFLLSMSISCNSEFRIADCGTAAIVIAVRRRCAYGLTHINDALPLAVPLLLELSAATEMVMAALELAVKDLLLFR